MNDLSSQDYDNNQNYGQTKPDFTKYVICQNVGKMKTEHVSYLKIVWVKLIDKIKNEHVNNSKMVWDYSNGPLPPLFTHS